MASSPGDERMTRRSAARLAWGLFLVFLGAGCAGLFLQSLNGSGTLDDQILAVSFTVIGGVGALIASRVPANAIGWILLTVATLPALGFFSEEYARYALRTPRGSFPGASTIVWLSTWAWIPSVGFLGTFLLLLFPTGRLPSSRWRPVAWLAGLSMAAIFVGTAFAPGPADQGLPDNPLGISGAGGFLDALTTAALPFLAGAIAFSLVSLVLRFRRARGDERAQLKWFVFAGILFAAEIIVETLSSEFDILPRILDGISRFLFPSFVALLPISAAIAVLKYRLYDIDLVINRTLVYGLLTALLALIYVGGVVGLGALLRVATGQEGNALVVAASTLAVAAVFGPARRRIQGFTDRRFYRQKYDAIRTLESFSSRLREQVDLEALTGELVGVVKETMQPAHVSLWLRSGQSVSGRSS
jgi:hypothetical protein